MHETHILESIFKYLTRQEKQSCRRIKKIYISLSEFGSISKEHFLEHFKKESSGTQWEKVKVAVKKVPVGAELEITRIDFLKTKGLKK